MILFGPNTKNTDLPSIAKAELTGLRSSLLAAIPLAADRLSKYHLQGPGRQNPAGVEPEGLENRLRVNFCPCADTARGFVFLLLLVNRDL
ncbi:hypothetical protein ACQ86N_32110 [Puia sp. P3]|uniref:hypothetical protein n=1 Tax=Puia sp. P3 TaxID=3423952 RepID=UPI003D67A431